MKNALKKVANPSAYKKAFKYVNTYGFGFVKDTIGGKTLPDYVAYNEWYKKAKPDADEVDRQRNYKFKYEPKISIIVPVLKCSVKQLNQTLESVKNQTYSNWELCAVSLASNDADVENLLNKIKADDDRIKIVTQAKDAKISDCLNSAVKILTGEYVEFVNGGDMLTCDALFEIVSANQETQHDVLYADDDCITEDLSYVYNYRFKPDWSPYFLECNNYIKNLFVVKKSLLDVVGRFNSKFDGAHQYDFILRCTDNTEDIFHISKVLYHCLEKKPISDDNDTNVLIIDAETEALKEHFKRKNIDVEVVDTHLSNCFQPIYSVCDNPLVSIIVVKSKDDEVSNLVNSIYENNTYKNFELIIACAKDDNQNDDHFVKLTNKYKNLKIILSESEYNFTILANNAVKSADGDYLLFLDSAAVVVSPNAISQMMGYCIQEDVGVVGAKLINADNTVEYAGLVVGLDDFAKSAFKGINKDDPGYLNKAQLAYDCSAVSKNCLLTKKDVFEFVGGFSDKFNSDVLDVDYCLKVQELNKRIICNNFSLWHIDNSNVAGSDSQFKKKKEDLKHDIKIFNQKWDQWLHNKDPFYNKNFDIRSKPYKIKNEAAILYSVDGYSEKPLKKDSTIGSNANNDIQVTITGWAFSPFNKKLQLKIIQNGHPVHFSTDWKNRSDLYKDNIINEIDNKAGFEIKFDCKKTSKKYLLLKEGNNEAKVELKPIEVKRSLDYNEWYKIHKPSKEELEQQKNTKFTYEPKFSIVVPLYKTPKKYLKLLVKSVGNQTYTNWELCFSDGSGQDSPIASLLKKLTKRDQRIKVIASDKQLQISDNTNLALTIAEGDYIVFADHDDELAPNALYECAKLINEHPDAEFIYTDEDKIDGNSKQHFEPHFKSDFNIDMLRSVNYICHMVCVKKSLQKKVGGLNQEFDGAQDYDFNFRCIESTQNIYHISKICYHWRSHMESTAGNADSKNYAFEAGTRAIQAHLDRVGLKGKVTATKYGGIYRTRYELVDNPLVSIIIPNKDHVDDLDKCINSIFNKTTYSYFELIIVENNSSQASTFDYYKQIQDKHNNIKVVNWNKKGFNYSTINNFGVKQCNGEYLLFLNNDIEVITGNFIEEMLSLCQRDDVGIVGAKLLYNDDTIQHAGVILGLGGVAGHAFMDENRYSLGYMGRPQIVHDVSIVTAACMLAKKSIFNECGGFNEQLAVAFNDVDFCMKVRDNNYLVAYTPYAELYHYESKSRGAEDSPEKVERFNSEIRCFQNIWSDQLQSGDPYYNPNFSLDDIPFKLNS